MVVQRKVGHPGARPPGVPSVLSYAMLCYAVSVGLLFLKKEVHIHLGVFLHTHRMLTPSRCRTTKFSTKPNSTSWPSIRPSGPSASCPTFNLKSCSPSASKPKSASKLRTPSSSSRWSRGALDGRTSPSLCSSTFGPRSPGDT
jgi:hypothetical protein